MLSETRQCAKRIRTPGGRDNCSKLHEWPLGARSLLAICQLEHSPTRSRHGVIHEAYFCHEITRLEKRLEDAGLARAGGQPVFAKVWAVEGVASFMAEHLPAQRPRPAEREFQPYRRQGGRGGGKIARLSKRCTWLQPSSSSAPALRNAGPREY